MLAPTVSIARRQVRVLLQNEAPAVPDGAGGFTPSWVDLPPPADASVVPASAGVSEHLAAGAALAASTTYVVTLPFRANVSTATRVLYGARTLYVTGVTDPDERHVELVLACEERVR
jgi:SPP1 family predicted phage head-tail adaptor